MEKKYKIGVELNLQQVLQTRILTGQCSNMSDLYTAARKICDEELGDIISRPLPRYEGGFHIAWQKSCFELVQGVKRKVVVVGDKKYYEDELATALKSINAIGE